MKILLIDFDSKSGIPSVPIMKLSRYYKSLGHEVGMDTPNPDMIFCSVIFSKNMGQAAGIKTLYPNVPIEIGGSGWDLKNKLPDYIEFLKPDYDLYPSIYSQGFTSRGCPNRCSFCVVPEKEGKIRIWQHPEEFHDDKFNTCMIMDNNLLALPEWFETVSSWFINSGIKMKSPQGWDARLLTEQSAGILKDIKHDGGIHFAWDNIKDEHKIIKSIRLLKNAGFNLRSDISFYVLCGFAMINGKPTQIPFSEDDLYRCNKLRELGVNAFVMPYHKKDKNINRLARWANRRWLYWSIPFSEMK